ncbi:MAG: monofunctional biosynthetic peptidoglycan transglycosylase [Weeksellaceae bacterium]|nr:monofunctional biosynthetic peptidoglycan transglycosylase [Weeksellaceae bacterium]
MRGIFRFFIKLIIFLLVLPWLYALILLVIPPPITITQATSMVEGHGLKRDYLPLHQIPENAAWAVIAAEDQTFAQHSGFDFAGIEKAMESNAKGKRVRGASTISQQVAKNVFLWQGRSWLRKGLETYCTFVIEVLWSKKRIVYTYLNIVEMGKGVFGIEAAAQHYFQKPAAQLTANESARIAAALPSPKTYKVNPASGYIAKRATWIERQTRNLKQDQQLKQIIQHEH